MRFQSCNIFVCLIGFDVLQGFKSICIKKSALIGKLSTRRPGQPRFCGPSLLAHGTWKKKTGCPDKNRSRARTESPAPLLLTSRAPRTQRRAHSLPSVHPSLSLSASRVSRALARLTSQFPHPKTLVSPLPAQNPTPRRRPALRRRGRRRRLHGRTHLRLS